MRLQFLTAIVLEYWQERIVDRGPDSAQLFHHREAAIGNVGSRIATLVRESDPPSAQIVGRSHQQARHFPIGATVQHHRAKRIGRRCVKAGGHDDHLGFEAIERRDHHAFESREISAMTRSGRQRHIDIVPPSAARALLRQPAGRRREEPVLMQ